MDDIPRGCWGGEGSRQEMYVAGADGDLNGEE